MGLLTAALIVGAGAAAYGAKEASKQRKSAEAQMRRNETEARENAKLVQTQEDTGADIVLGDNTTSDTKRAKRRAARSKMAADATPSLGTSILGDGGVSVGGMSGLR